VSDPDTPPVTLDPVQRCLLHALDHDRRLNRGGLTPIEQRCELALRQYWARQGQRWIAWERREQ